MELITYTILVFLGINANNIIQFSLISFIKEPYLIFPESDSESYKEWCIYLISLSTEYKKVARGVGEKEMPDDLYRYQRWL